VKNPDYPDTLYVTGLVGPQTVNTMPEDTLNATVDHATVSGDTLSGTGDDAREVFAALEDLGVDLDDVFRRARARGRREVRQLLAGAARHHRGASVSSGSPLWENPLRDSADRRVPADRRAQRPGDLRRDR
jgi:hypothetical protein